MHDIKMFIFQRRNILLRIQKRKGTLTKVISKDKPQYVNKAITIIRVC